MTQTTIKCVVHLKMLVDLDVGCLNFQASGMQYHQSQIACPVFVLNGLRET